MVEDDMYRTTNSTYGTAWNNGQIFQQSFTQSEPHKTLTERYRASDRMLPKDKRSLALVHNPEHPCGITSMSNVPTNSRGEFTNVKQDLFSDRQGLWSNSSFNTPGAIIENGPTGTYSNLQGGWGRIGPSTYDVTHGRGTWVDDWNVNSSEPATLRSMYDHRNVNPAQNVVPVESYPQNM